MNSMRRWKESFRVWGVGCRWIGKDGAEQRFVLEKRVDPENWKQVDRGNCKPLKLS